MKKTKIFITVIVTVVVVLPYLLAFKIYLDKRELQKKLRGGSTEQVMEYPSEALEPGTGAPSLILVDKESMTLSVIDDKGRELANYGIACGKNYGAKRVSGDNRTPEGIFEVQQIQDAHDWTHDFGDGKGVIEGCYGNWFIRLLTPGFTGIGIHGTHAPESIGTRASEGCIRLHNEDLNKLRAMVQPGMRVVIVPGRMDRQANKENGATPGETTNNVKKDTNKDVKKDSPKNAKQDGDSKEQKDKKDNDKDDKNVKKD